MDPARPQTPPEPAPVPVPERIAVRRALITVWDKQGIVDLARAARDAGAELLSTGGTAAALAGAGIPVTPIEEVTRFPAILDGRVKTLHPAVFGAILGRDIPAHREELARLGLSPIDLVVVNLYPFEAWGARAPMEEALELIDIGGVALLRAAAKNWPRVAVVCDPAQYAAVADELRREGGLSARTRRRLAAQAFARTAAYDAAVAGYLQADAEGAAGRFPERLLLPLALAQELRYGENPHQAAAFYRRADPRPSASDAGESADASVLPLGRQLQGKELSFNNLLDLEAAWGLVSEFDEPAAAIVKHTTPCGAATGADAAAAYRAALACDPVSAFGGVVALNRPLDDATAAAIAGVFTEAVIAPEVTAEARQALRKKANLRLVEAGPPARGRAAVARAPASAAGGSAVAAQPSWDVRSAFGGILVQEPDGLDLDESRLRVPTRRAPTPSELADLRFAWKVAKWVKSNAIVLARDGATVGIGGGQPNRVGAVEIAVKLAGERAKGAVMASDAFFPFRDGIDAAARAGVTAVIQPGGSVRDEEVLAAADEHGLAMVLTGIRHFRH